MLIGTFTHPNEFLHSQMCQGFHVIFSFILKQSPEIISEDYNLFMSPGFKELQIAFWFLFPIILFFHLVDIRDSGREAIISQRKKKHNVNCHLSNRPASREKPIIAVTFFEYRQQHTMNDYAIAKRNYCSYFNVPLKQPFDGKNIASFCIYFTRHLTLQMAFILFQAKAKWLR